MAKYNVTLLFDASESINVEADSVEDAIEQAHQKTQATICHYCARHLDLGDIYKEIVSDENDNELEVPA